MEQQNIEPVVVYAPRMHEALVPAAAPVAVLGFDPGLETPQQPAEGRGRYEPAELPLPPAQARTWLRSMLQWGLQFESPGQLASVAAAEVLAKKRDIGGMDPAELAELQRFASQSEPTVPKTSQERQQAARLQAQLRLILAWTLEERNMELSNLGQGLASQYERFGQALGLEQDDEAAEAGLNRPLVSDAGEEQMPRLEVAGAMLAFLPAGSCLYTQDAELAAAWEEQGVVFAPMEENEELAAALGSAEGLRQGAAPGWKLAGLRGPVEDMPWLEQEYLAAVSAAE